MNSAINARALEHLSPNASNVTTNPHAHTRIPSARPQFPGADAPTLPKHNTITNFVPKSAE